MELIDKYVLVEDRDGQFIQYATYDEAVKAVGRERVWAVMEGEGSDVCNCPSVPTRASYPDGDDGEWAYVEAWEDADHDPDCKSRWPDHYALPGFHLVNILYFVGTTEPWTEADENVEYVL